MSNDAFDHVSDILRVVSDPKKSEAVLKEYRDLLAKNAALADQAAKAQAEAEKKLDQAHEALEQAKGVAQTTAAKERELINRQMRLDERGRELDEQHRILVGRQDAHKEAAARKDAELSKRGAALNGLEMERAKFAADRKLLDEQMERARSFLKV
jgi:hypothetical protein